MAGALKLVCLMLAVAMVAGPMAMVAEAAISCPQVERALAPCIGYLRTGGFLPPGCCNGVRSLNSAARTTPDRRSACNCLQGAANKFGVKEAYASGLPGRCGVNIPYKISRSTNCNSVK